MDAGAVLGVVLGCILAVAVAVLGYVFWPKGRAQTSLKVREPNWELLDERAAAKQYANP